MVQSVWAATAARTLWDNKSASASAMFNPVASATILEPRSTNFVGQLHVHHAVALHVTESNHRSGREPVEEKLVAVQPSCRSAVTNSGPVTATTG